MADRQETAIVPCTLTDTWQHPVGTPLKSPEAYAAAVAAALAIARQTLQHLGLKVPGGSIDAMLLRKEARQRREAWESLAEQDPSLARVVAHEASLGILYEAMGRLYELLEGFERGNLPHDPCAEVNLWAGLRLAQGLAGLQFASTLPQQGYRAIVVSGKEADDVVVISNIRLRAAARQPRQILAGKVGTFSGIRVSVPFELSNEEARVYPLELGAYPPGFEDWQRDLSDNGEPATSIPDLPPERLAYKDARIDEARLVYDDRGYFLLEVVVIHEDGSRHPQYSGGFLIPEGEV